MNLLDFIFPKKCVGCGKLGNYICKNCFFKIEFVDKPICAVCSRQAIGGRTHPGCLGKYTLDGLVVACRYRGVIRAAVKKLKYRWVSAISLVLVDLLASAMWRYDISDKAILVPIPLYNSRKNWRGFNQAELLASELSKRFSVKININIISRVVNTKTQVGLSRDERKKNIKGAFEISQSVRHGRGSLASSSTHRSGPEAAKCKGKRYILVDDVFTTGATMSEAANVLKRAGAEEVWAMAVALD